MSHWESTNVLIDREGNVGSLRNMIKYPIISLYSVFKGDFGNWNLLDDEFDKTNYSHILTSKGVRLQSGFSYKLIFKIQVLDLSPVRSIDVEGPILDLVGFDKHDTQTFVKNTECCYECYTEKNTQFIHLKTRTITFSDSLEKCAFSVRFSSKIVTHTTHFSTYDIDCLPRLLEEYPCDCQIILADGSRMFCHSLVLKASSHFFNTAIHYSIDEQVLAKSIFTLSDDGLMTLNLIDNEFSSKLWELAFHWMLYNQLPLDNIDILQDLYSLGDFYQIRGLPKHILVILRKSLDKNSFVHVNPFLLSLMSMALSFSTSDFVEENMKHQWQDILASAEKLLSAHPELFSKNNEEFLIGYSEYLQERRKIFGIECKDSYIVLGKRNWSR